MIVRVSVRSLHSDRRSGSLVMALICCIFAVRVLLRQPDSKAALVVGGRTMTMAMPLFARHYGGDGGELET